MNLEVSVETLAQIDGLIRENARLRKALNFYADETNYYEPGPHEWDQHKPSVVQRDEGYTARVALIDTNAPKETTT